MSTTATRKTSTVILTFVTACVFVFIVDDAAQGGSDNSLVQRFFFEHFAGSRRSNANLGRGNTSSSGTSDMSLPFIKDPTSAVVELDDEALLREMQNRLTPKQILFVDDGDKKTLKEHQFLHLHHMKTGGTSMDELVNCALARLKKAGYHFNYTNLHECGEAHYRSCVTGESPNCLQSVQRAAVMSYCAPLKDLSAPFAWLNSSSPSNKQPEAAVSSSKQQPPIHGALTVLRHPVARVWSMYRFQTKSCYQCRTLKEIYAEIDGGTSDLTRMCKLQLLNHQTRNLLSAAPPNDVPDSIDHVREAVHNMKSVFTLVGLTEDMPNTAAMAARVFPWLAETVNWDEAVGGGSANNNNNNSGPAAASSSSKKCELPHANGSPANNHCGADGRSHWDLPAAPDEETARIILEHNRMDVGLYEAAVAQFELQKRALGLV